MHLQQTKRASRTSGGPQYYFHDLTDEVRTYLRTKRAVPVALMTPYGATKSHFIALSKDYKLQGSKIVGGKVGHDRIQQAWAKESIGEAIRKWYALPVGLDFERIDVEVEIRDARFHVIPIGYRLVGSRRSVPITRPVFPLSFHRNFQSELWRKQLRSVARRNDSAFRWAIQEIRRIVAAHDRPGTPNVLEADMLRASGPLRICGLELGPYLGRGYDCKSQFQFLNYVPYEVPVELKKRSSGFRYQQQKYGKEELSRAVVLCAFHDLTNVPHSVDILELSHLARMDPFDL